MYKGVGRRYQRRRRRRTKTVFVVKFRFDLAIVVIHVCKEWRSPRYFELKPPKMCLNFYTLRIYSKRNDIEIDTINKSKRMAFLFAYDEKWVFLSTIYILLISAYNWIKESTHKVILLFKELWIDFQYAHYERKMLTELMFITQSTKKETLFHIFFTAAVEAAAAPATATTTSTPKQIWFVDDKCEKWQ